MLWPLDALEVDALLHHLPQRRDVPQTCHRTHQMLNRKVDLQTIKEGEWEGREGGGREKKKERNRIFLFQLWICQYQNGVMNEPGPLRHRGSGGRKKVPGRLTCTHCQRNMQYLFIYESRRSNMFFFKKLILFCFVFCFRMSIPLMAINKLSPST